MSVKKIVIFGAGTVTRKDHYWQQFSYWSGNSSI